AGQLVIDLEGQARGGAGQDVVEVVAVDVGELAFLHGAERLFGLAGQVGQDPDDEGQFDLLHRPAGLDVVRDLDAGTADPVQFVPKALAGHDGSPAWLRHGELRIPSFKNNEAA